MKITKTLVSGLAIGGTLAGASMFGFSGPAHAGTLVTCGPNGAAYIVKVVPAGCRVLAATSAPTHPPDNAVEESRLGFTFNASAPKQEAAQPVAKQQKQPTSEQPLALW